MLYFVVGIMFIVVAKLLFNDFVVPNFVVETLFVDADVLFVEVKLMFVVIVGMLFVVDVEMLYVVVIVEVVVLSCWFKSLMSEQFCVVRLGSIGNVAC